jgi:inositol transporter-like SP family MFS transporter
VTAVTAIGTDTAAAVAKPWTTATLAGMASYLDAGTIVAVSASISRWQTMFRMSSWQLGFLSAALTVCIGLGAILGGRIGDRFGRKKVYAIDLLVYAFGVLWLVFAVGTPMLFVGVIIRRSGPWRRRVDRSRTCQRDVPAGNRGRLVTFTQFMWALGPLVVIVLVLLATGLGDLMPRVIFVTSSSSRASRGSFAAG